MNWKRVLTIGGISTVLSSAACIIYAKIYSEAFYVDFSSIAGPVNFIAASAIGCFLMAIGYLLAAKWKENSGVGWANVVFTVLSFASIAGVLAFNLPLEIEFPEMFPGYVIPTHFFPVLSVMTVLPFFKLHSQA